MSDRLLHHFQGLIIVGTLSLCTGLLSYTYSSPQRCSRGYQLGILSGAISPYLLKIEQLGKAFPVRQSIVNQIVALTTKFAALYTQGATPQNVRRLMRVQRKLFKLTDKFALALSECVAVDDVFKAVDDFKQVITDVCLSLDTF